MHSSADNCNPDLADQVRASASSRCNSDTSASAPSGQRSSRRAAGREQLDLADILGQFVFAHDDRHAKAAAVGVLQLLAQLLGFGIDFDAEARAAQLRGQPQIVVPAASASKSGMKISAGVETCSIMPSSSMPASRRSSPSEAPTPGSS